MWRLRDRFYELQGALSFRRRRARSAPGGRMEVPVLRGNMRRMLVLKPPGEMFDQAIFILHDNYFETPGTSRQELLEQAKTAAEGYIDTSLPKGKSTPFFPSAASVFVFGAACAVLALWLAGLIG